MPADSPFNRTLKSLVGRLAYGQQKPGSSTFVGGEISIGITIIKENSKMSEIQILHKQGFDGCMSAFF
jgi:hypothetical protein